jgi:hypothetical protein
MTRCAIAASSVRLVGSLVLLTAVGCGEATPSAPAPSGGGDLPLGLRDADDQKADSSGSWGSALD